MVHTEDGTAYGSEHLMGTLGVHPGTQPLGFDWASWQEGYDKAHKRPEDPVSLHSHPAYAHDFTYTHDYTGHAVHAGGTDLEGDWALCEVVAGVCLLMVILQFWLYILTALLIGAAAWLIYRFRHPLATIAVLCGTIAWEHGRPALARMRRRVVARLRGRPLPKVERVYRISK